MDAIRADDVVRSLLKMKCQALESVVEADAIIVKAPMSPGIDDAVRNQIEKLSQGDGKRNRLAVVLETDGGSIEVVERIHDVMRHHYGNIVFIIPNYAYSAGTVLALSGDDIFMDYYSVLGPIDPQIRNKEGRYVPGLGYLEKYNQLIEKGDNLSVAELEFLVRKFDAAELFQLEMAKKHSEDLIEKWLSEHKFKHWAQRETSGEAVGEPERKARAREIAELLGNPKEWQSHSRGIPMKVLTSDRVNLKINDFGRVPELDKAIREYYDLFIDYMMKIGVEIAIHSRRSLWHVRTDR